jgi:hypothetical protein
MIITLGAITIAMGHYVSNWSVETAALESREIQHCMDLGETYLCCKHPTLCKNQPRKMNRATTKR